MPLLTSSGSVAQAQSMHMVNGGAGDAMQKYMLQHHAPQPTALNTASTPTDQLAPPTPHNINGGDTLSVLSSAHVSAPSPAASATAAPGTGTSLASAAASSDITNASLPNGNMVNPLYNGTVD